jgi:hypothetical protein
MASKDPAESIGEGLAALLQIIFSLTFPLVIFSLCAISMLLMIALNAPEFAFWPGIAVAAFVYAQAHTWAAVVFGIVALAALPLAWVAFKEREIRSSKAILEWVITILVLWFTFWLRTVWPYSGSGWQLLAYAFLLFIGWNGVIEASLSTLAIVAIRRANRPMRTEPPRHQPHGPGEPRPARGEPESI